MSTSCMRQSTFDGDARSSASCSWLCGRLSDGVEISFQVVGFYKEKSGAAKGAAEGIQRTTGNAIDEASSYGTIPAEKVVGQPAAPSVWVTCAFAYSSGVSAQICFCSHAQQGATQVSAQLGHEEPYHVLQLEHLNAAFSGLRPVAMDVFHLLGYVSLNMAGFRKMLKKYAKNVEPAKPQPGAHCCPILSSMARQEPHIAKPRLAAIVNTWKPA